MEFVRKMLLAFCGCIILLSCGWLSAASGNEKIVAFENANVPSFVKVGKGTGKAEISGRHYVDGSKSLRWDWERRGTLQFNVPITVLTDKQASKIMGVPALSTFAVWIYNEKALPGASLRFDFGRSPNKIDCGFNFGLDFTGWRTCWVGFTRDMQGKPSANMDFLRITAPDKAAAGTVFIDQMIMSNIGDVRHQYDDYQVPFVNPVRDDHWRPRIENIKISFGKNLPPVTKEDIKVINTIEHRLADSFLSDSKYSVVDFAVLEKRFKKLGILERDGVITGKHLIFASHKAVYSGQSGYIKQYVDFKDYSYLMFDIALAYRKNPEGPHAARLKEMFMLMSRHMLDQGWTEGSALGTMHHYGYSTRRWFPAVFLMRNELHENKLLEPMSMAMQWFTNVRKIFNGKKYWVADMDYFNTLSASDITIILSMPLGAEKVAFVKRYSEFFNDILSRETTGGAGGFKVDGTAFHHMGHYPGYAFGAINAASFMCYLFSGTPYRMSPQAMKNLRRALLAARIYCNPQTGMGLCGRHPFGESNIRQLRFAFKNLTLTEKNNTGKVDRELAAEYLRLVPGDYKNFGENVKPEPLPNGHWSFNYGCFGIHRDGGKMVTLKGYNRYVWSSEIYTKDNRYGRYQSNGSVQIMSPDGSIEDGYVQDGWDWNRNPGATMLYRPLDVLENPRRHTLMLTSQECFSGSSNLLNKYGVFGVVLTEPEMQNFDPSFKAEKSMFCFGDRIICLGSGISSDNKKYRTETILFQYALKNAETPTWFDSEKAVTGLNVKKQSRTPVWLVDASGNGYYVVSGGAVDLTRTHQFSKDNKMKKPTEGDFAAAWIDHGQAPRDVGYEYLIMLHSSAAKMTETAKIMRAPETRPYKVIRRDNNAHIVYDKASGVTGCVFFKPQSNIDCGPVAAVDMASLVMFRSEPDTSLVLSVCDPDLNYVHGWQSDNRETPKNVKLVLRGNWKLKTPHPQVKVLQGNNNTTILNYIFKHGLKIELHLEKVE